MMFVTLRSVLAGIAAFAAMPVVAQEVPTAVDYFVLSDRDGDPTYIVRTLVDWVGSDAPVEAPVEALHAKAISGKEIASLFAGLCLTKPFDRVSYDSGRSTFAPDFSSRARGTPEVSALRPLIEGSNVVAAPIVQARSDYGYLSFWTGDGADQLKDRDVVRYLDDLPLIGQVKKGDFDAPQCNLTLRVSGMSSAKPMLDEIQGAANGFTLVKRAEAAGHGNGAWSMVRPDGRTVRLIAKAEQLRKPEQIVHITLQLLPVSNGS